MWSEETNISGLSRYRCRYVRTCIGNAHSVHMKHYMCPSTVWTVQSLSGAVCTKECSVHINIILYCLIAYFSFIIFISCNLASLYFIIACASSTSCHMILSIHIIYSMSDTGSVIILSIHAQCRGTELSRLLVVELFVVLVCGLRSQGQRGDNMVKFGPLICNVPRWELSLIHTHGSAGQNSGIFTVATNIETGSREMTAAEGESLGVGFSCSAMMQEQRQLWQSSRSSQDHKSCTCGWSRSRGTY